MKIRKLSEKEVNRIAAGEVVERPASVVKELVENAMDAGATKIIVHIRGGGKDYIAITDNGSGMSLDDIKLAVQNHTTSKLKKDDIMNIDTFGFRGEALASISSVSKLIITSSDNNSGKGVCFNVSDDTEQIVIANQGTKMEVFDLFCTIPARLKFLKSDRSESTACVDVIRRIALIRFDIAFDCYIDEKRILNIPIHNNLTDRVAKILGNEYVSNAVQFEYKNDYLDIKGLASVPTFNHGSSENQYFFVNKRYIKDKLLNVALKIAYTGTLSSDRYPFALLDIQIDNRLIDVNVHPAKTEIRFRDTNDIRSIITRSVKSAVEGISSITSSSLSNMLVDFDDDSTHKNTSPIDSTFNTVTTVEKDYLGATHSTTHYSEKNQNAITLEPKIDSTSKIQQQIAPYNVRDEGREYVQQKVFSQQEDHTKEENIINSVSIDLGKAICQIKNMYIVAESEDGMILIDQHAVHERILLEKMKNSILSGNAQRLLTPVIVNLPTYLHAEIMLSYEKVLASLGFSIKSFGESAIMVSTVPQIFDINYDYDHLIKQIADTIFEESNRSTQEVNKGQEVIAMIQNKIIEIGADIACKKAIKAGHIMHIDEMNAMLRMIENTPYLGQCNHGRPTYVKIPLSKIHSIFERT